MLVYVTRYQNAHGGHWGEVSEWFKEPVLKTGDPQGPWVRIPPSPPFTTESSFANFALEKYSRGRRGAPAKGVGRETGARVQIPPSPPGKARTNVRAFCFTILRPARPSDTGHGAFTAAGPAFAPGGDQCPGEPGRRSAAPCPHGSAAGFCRRKVRAAARMSSTSCRTTG